MGEMLGMSYTVSLRAVLVIPVFEIANLPFELKSQLIGLFPPAKDDIGTGVSQNGTDPNVAMSPLCTEVLLAGFEATIVKAGSPEEKFQL